MTEKNTPKNILVTGSSGFLGQSVVNLLRQNSEYVVKETRSSEHDLTKLDDCIEATKGIDTIINLAGLIPSRVEQKRRPAEVFTRNTLINIHIAEAARLNDVKRVIFVSSVVAYPEHTALPLSEDNLWNGPVADANYAYGTAKRLTETIARAYRDQYNLEATTLFLPNLYGPNDKFTNNPPPLIPSIIKQIGEAIEAKAQIIHGGNNGEVELDLLYVEDAASAIICAVKQETLPSIINISTGNTIAIKNVFEIIAKELGYHGKISWETQVTPPPRIMDTGRAEMHLGWKSGISFSEGIQKTVDVYLFMSKNKN